MISAMIILICIFLPFIFRAASWASKTVHKLYPCNSTRAQARRIRAALAQKAAQRAQAGQKTVPQDAKQQYEVALVPEAPQYRLFFAELNISPWMSSTVKNIQKKLIKKGWKMLPFLSEGYDKFYSRTKWFDPNHPDVDAVVEILINLTSNANFPSNASVLVLGDSTLSYCYSYYKLEYTDEEREKIKSAIESRVYDATGTKISLYAVPDTSFTSYNCFYYKWWQAVGIHKQSFDAILLVGGWNQLSLKGVDAAINEFTKEALAAF